MKKLIVASLAFSLVLTALTAYAGVFKVYVVRRDTNIYTFTSGRASGVIFTKYCYEYTYGDDAILKYEAYSYENKLIFSDGTTCDVESVALR